MTEYDHIELRKFAVDRALDYHRATMPWDNRSVIHTATVIEHYLLTGKILGTDDTTQK
ncbi:hypothetical protein PHIM7_16 [Sinorhizobium phage phiM7]|uniref:Uncharacterized protein n=2 Tax=Emdodecavirus TaxID=1980937 RepID=S5MAM3_9CAUD|nr:hypothetical protein AB690_gp020 [Sinorhizobium phage phiM12]YP_009601141.1 hypothetical protein FDH46_gp016 [Sinorhizobium phage phiM7]AGR47658.2 hypothetical protein SmphiM12_026 [Sinorhizobium phage phiM12]AKF12564.1 hypothetical protein PHIM7_16 [Sinorhizobium phage phiM7]AKF12924.1 hypothetical protein PHIM19_17 [Sinorhizobium phage phiM19]